MPGKFCVSLTCAKDNPDKATVAFVVANAAVASDKDTVVFLSTEGVRLAVRGYARRHRRGGLRPAQGPDGQLRGGRREDLRLLPVLQAAEAGRDQPGRRRGHRRRGQARRVHGRELPGRLLLTLNPTRLIPVAARRPGRRVRRQSTRRPTSSAAGRPWPPRLDAWKNGEPPGPAQDPAGPGRVYRTRLRQTHTADSTTPSASRTRPGPRRRSATRSRSSSRTARARPRSRPVVFMVALKSPIVVARDPYE